MIRIKCPKCSYALTLDDDEAGGVGECEECGAKFRIPAAKAKPVAARAGAKKRADDEDEEDEEDDDERPGRRVIRDDDEDDDKEGQSGKRRQQLIMGLPPQTWYISAFSVGLIFVATVSFLASLYIKNTGVGLGSDAFLLPMDTPSERYTCINGPGFGIGCFGYSFWLLGLLGLMLKTWHDNAGLGMAPPITCVLMPCARYALPQIGMGDSVLVMLLLLLVVNIGATIACAIKYWADVRPLVPVIALTFVIAVTGFLGGMISEDWKSKRRKEKVGELRLSAIVRVLDVASVRGMDPAPDQPKGWSR